MNGYVESLLMWTDTSDEVDREMAEHWYDNAQEVALQMVQYGQLNFDQACCIIAAFSIRQRWDRNVELALRFATGERNLPTFGSINRIAENIVRYDDPYTALNGDKTNSFARNIAGDVDAVTIDVWMLRAFGLDATKTPGRKVYTELADAVRIAAVENNMTPRDYQALVWIVIRGSAE